MTQRDINVWVETDHSLPWVRVGERIGVEVDGQLTRFTADEARRLMLDLEDALWHLRQESTS